MVLQVDIFKKYTNYIENFDKQNTTIVFLFVMQAAGSFLLESLINGHDQVLTMPVNFFPDSYTYYERNIQYRSLEEVVKSFVRSGFFTYEDSIVRRMPESNKTEIFLVEFESTLLLILKNLKTINNRNFFLALNLAYAHLKNIDISKIKTIFNHYHEFALNYSFDEYSLDKECTALIIKKDFPEMKILLAIRNFVEYRMKMFQLHREAEPIETIYTWKNLMIQFYKISCYFYISIIYKGLFKDDFLFVKFEDIHLKTEDTMARVADFLNIDYNEYLLESSFEGVPWYWHGYDRKSSPKHGTNPNYDPEKWKKTFPDEQTKTLYSKLFNPINRAFGYEEYTDYVEPKRQEDLYKILDVDKEFWGKTILNECIGTYSIENYNSKTGAIIHVLKRSLKYSFSEQKHIYLYNFVIIMRMLKYYFFEYKRERKKILERLFKFSSFLSKCNSIYDFSDFYLNERAREKSIIDTDSVKKHLAYIKKKYRNRRIVLYGAGKFFDVMIEKYDFSEFNIIGVVDIAYENKDMPVINHSYQAIAPSKLEEFEFDVMLISIMHISTGIYTYILDEVLKRKKNIEIELIHKKISSDFIC